MSTKLPHPVPARAGQVVEIRDGNHEGTTVVRREGDHDEPFLFVSHDRRAVGYAKDIKAAFVNAGFRVEIYSGMPGYLVRVLGERQNYQEAERLARQHGAKWVSEAQAYEHIAALGYPNTAA